MSESRKILTISQAFSRMFSVSAAPGTYVTYALFQLSGYIRLICKIRNREWAFNLPFPGAPLPADIRLIHTRPEKR
jgi:hypothetical protein